MIALLFTPGQLKKGPGQKHNLSIPSTDATYPFDFLYFFDQDSIIGSFFWIVREVVLSAPCNSLIFRWSYTWGGTWIHRLLMWELSTNQCQHLLWRCILFTLEDTCSWIVWVVELYSRNYLFGSPCLIWPCLDLLAHPICLYLTHSPLNSSDHIFVKKAFGICNCICF